MLSTAQKRQFRNDGYLVLPGAVSRAQVTAARHKDVETIGHDAYVDIWREWDGIAELGAV